MGFWLQHLYLTALIDRRNAESGAGRGGDQAPQTIEDIQALPMADPTQMMAALRGR